MANNLEAAFAPAEAEHKARVLAATWGHLAPQPRRKYKGHVLFAKCCDGDYALIDYDFDGLDGSPWLYEALIEYIAERARDEGAVLRFDGTCMMFSNGRFRFSGAVRKVIRVARESAPLPAPRAPGDAVNREDRRVARRVRDRGERLAAAVAVKPLPPTAQSLLDLLTANGGAIDYRDPRVTTSGLTALRGRGIARVTEGKPKRIVLVEGKDVTP